MSERGSEMQPNFMNRFHQAYHTSLLH